MGPSSAAESPADEAQRTVPFGLAALRLRPADLVLLLVPVALLLGHGRPLYFPDWTFRFAVVLACLPVGLFILARMVLARDRASLAALPFVVAATIATLAAPNPLLSFKGTWGQPSFLLLYLGAFGLWALGRSISTEGVRSMRWVLGAAVAINVVIGVLQIVLDITGGPLATVSGRASGLLDNPVYYGGVVAGYAASCMVTGLRRSTPAWWAWTAFAAFGAALAGSRVATIALFLAAIATLAVQRLQRSAWISASAGWVGMAAASVFTRLVAEVDIVTRFGPQDDGTGGRLQLWRYDLDAIRERPYFGWGLGNHGLAVRGRFSLEFTRDYAWDERLLSWPDPHNVLLHIAVATGVIGLAAAVLFFAVCLRHTVDWPLATMVLVTAVTWSLQPLAISSFPLTMFVLGAAVGPRLVARERASLTARSAVGALVVMGVVAGAYVLAADWRLQRAVESGRPEVVKSAASWFWEDPIVAGEFARARSQIYEFIGGDPEPVLDAARRPVEIDPNNPLYWAELGRRQIALERFDEASASSDRAIELQPYNPTAWQNRLAIAVLTEDRGGEQEALEVVCALELPLCTLGLDDGAPRAQD